MFISSTKVFISIARNVLLQHNAFVFYLELGLEILKIEQKLGKNFLRNFISSWDGPEQSTETRHEMKESKETALHLLCTFGRCWLVLRSSSHALFQYFFQVHPYVK